MVIDGNSSCLQLMLAIEPHQISARRSKYDGSGMSMLDFEPINEAEMTFLSRTWDLEQRCQRRSDVFVFSSRPRILLAGMF